MLFKLIIFTWLSSLALCDKSFTIVLDTTTSMQEELDVLKGSIASALNVSADVSNYILVPFNDPDVGEPIVVQTPRELISSLNSMTVGGGRKCPENSLAGIEKALQISKEQSNIFVFTDAYSRDADKLSSIENLCRSTRSQVVIFLSGFCLPSQMFPNMNIQTYYDVAKACSGAVIRFDPATLRQAFTYIREVTNVQWTDVFNYETFTDYKEMSFSVDSFTKAVLLVASGEYPVLEISPPPGSSNKVEKVLDSRHTQVLRIKSPSVGEHRAVIRCRGKTALILYKKYELPIQFGFSSKVPRSMKETSRRPMPGRTNYILVDASQSNMKLETVEIQMDDEQERKVLVFEEKNTAGLYQANVFVAPYKAFRIWVKGYDTSTYQEIRGSTEALTPQQAMLTEPRWMKPQSEILEGESITADFGTNATLACKVTAYPTPNILWEDGMGEMLPSESLLLEIPSLYISYVSIDNATVNTKIYCKSKNTEGEDSQSINLYVHRPYTFEVIQTPTDQTIEYGGEGKLYCEVSAYPTAETKWYHNDSVIIMSDEVEVDPESNTLWIKNMTVNNVGEYKCEITNEANTKTFTASVTISGIEAPEVEVDKTSVILKLGEWSYLECRIIKGKPSPVITWTFKSEDGFDFTSLPDGVVTDEDKVKIASAQPEHKGTYRCDASNIEGHHSADITVELQYAPVIANADPHTVTVKEEDEVVLPCEVNASPPATVRWEMSQDDVIMTLDDRHKTDQRHTHRFKALWRDAGKYHCIAENNIGRAEKSVTVNVLVAPYIEAPKQKRVIARTGDNLVLMCNVQYGNPAPTTKWEFIALDSTSRILSRNNSSSPLYLNNVSYVNEGTYFCIADNEVGTDSIKIYVKIQ